MFLAEVKAGLLAMESPSNGDVEGMKSPGLELDKGSHGLIHRQDYLSIPHFLLLLILPAVRESLKYEWDWGSYSQICTVRELEWPVFNFAILENFDFTANNFYQLDKGRLQKLLWGFCQ